ncbi:MAG: diguanylate cyclase [Candidatus Atribacteria bacterium]|nr:diguanylate cyclase [Candidatus Atribacteria bacterium]
MRMRLFSGLKPSSLILINLIIVFLLWHFSAEGFASLLITEFMASNGSIILDQSGKLNDWIEIQNRSSQPIDLSGYFISDKLNNPLKWQIPEGSHQETIIPGGGFTLLIADGEPDQGPLHLNFELSKDGESIILTAPDGNTTIDVITFGPQWKDVSYGRSEMNPETWMFHLSPTPRSPNQGVRTTSYWIAGLYLFYKLYRELFLTLFAFFIILIYISIRLSQALKKLRRVEEKQTSLIQAVPEIILQLNHKGQIEWLNQVGIDFFGDGMIGKDCRKIFKNATSSLAFKENSQNQKFDNLFPAGTHFITEFPSQKGEFPKVIDWSTNPYLHKGRKNGILLVGRDITQQQYNEKRIKNSEKNYRDLFEKTPIGILKVDLHGKILDINQHMMDILGVSHKEKILQMTLSNLFISEQPLFMNEDKQLAKNQVISGDRECISQWGKKFWLRYKIFPIFDDLGEPKELIIAGEDVTASKEAENKIQYINLHDSLTGLYNRLFFEEELKRLNTDRQYPLSLIIGDVNGLKILNDAFGHLEGDQLLKKTAEILKRCCRKEDIISRWGGDEFVIILPQTDHETVLQICDRIRNECQIQENFLIPLSISLGVSTKSVPIQDIQTIVIEADENMYQEKLIESNHYQRMLLSTFISNLKPKTWHSPELCRLCLWFGMVLNLPYSEEELRYLADLHDLGKINMDINFLSQTNRLDEEGWKKIKKHPEIGYRIAQAIHQISTIADAIWAHHERWDGTGYPRGLSKENIPLLARIMAIADAYDAMRSGRPYQPPLTKEEVINELLRCSGSQFDPNLISLFIKHCRTITSEETFIDDQNNHELDKE